MGLSCMLKGQGEDTVFFLNKNIYDVANVKVLLTDLKHVNTNVLAKLYDVTINLEVPTKDDDISEDIVCSNLKTACVTKVPPVLSCLECNKTFMNRHQYKLHQKMHEITCKRKKKCIVCDELLPSKEKLCHHMQKHFKNMSSEEHSNNTNMATQEILKNDFEPYLKKLDFIRSHKQISENLDTDVKRVDKVDQQTQNSSEVSHVEHGNSTNMSTHDEQLKINLKTYSKNSKYDSRQNKLISEDSDADVDQVNIVFNDIEFENKVTSECEVQPIVVDTTIKENIAKVGRGFTISTLSKSIKETRYVPATTENEVIDVIDSDDETVTKESPVTKNNIALQSSPSKLPANRILVLNPNSLKLISLNVSDIPPLVPFKCCDTCKTVNAELKQGKTCDKCFSSNTVNDGSDDDLVIDLEEDKTNDTSGAMPLSNCSQQIKVVPANNSESNGQTVHLGDISIMVTCVSCKLKMKPDQVQFIGGQVKCNDCVSKKLICFYCKIQFSSTDSLKFHIEHLHFCKICSKHYPDIAKHKLKQVPCNICHVLICKKYSIPRHYQSKHNKFWCSNCNSVFDGEYDLYVHIREMHKV